MTTVLLSAQYHCCCSFTDIQKLHHNVVFTSIWHSKYGSSWKLSSSWDVQPWNRHDGKTVKSASNVRPLERREVAESRQISFHKRIAIDAMRARTWAFRMKKLRHFRNSTFFCTLEGMQWTLQNTLPIVHVKYVAPSASKKHLKPFWFTFQCAEGVPAAHQLFYLYVTKYSRIPNVRFSVCKNKAFYTMAFRYKSMLMCTGWPRKMPVNTSLRTRYIS